MKVVISPRAEKQLKKTSKLDQIAIAQKIRSLTPSQFVPYEEKLKGYTNIFRVRLGDYRIVYRKKQNELYIVIISHRKDVYNLLNKLLN